MGILVLTAIASYLLMGPLLALGGHVLQSGSRGYRIWLGGQMSAGAIVLFIILSGLLDYEQLNEPYMVSIFLGLAIGVVLRLAFPVALRSAADQLSRSAADEPTTAVPTPWWARGHGLIVALGILLIPIAFLAPRWDRILASLESVPTPWGEIKITVKSSTLPAAGMLIDAGVGEIYTNYVRDYMGPFNVDRDIKLAILSNHFTDSGLEKHSIPHNQSIIDFSTVLRTIFDCLDSVPRGVNQTVLTHSYQAHLASILIAVGKEPELTAERTMLTVQLEDLISEKEKGFIEEALSDIEADLLVVERLLNNQSITLEFKNFVNLGFVDQKKCQGISHGKLLEILKDKNSRKSIVSNPHFYIAAAVIAEQAGIRDTATSLLEDNNNLKRFGNNIDYRELLAILSLAETVAKTSPDRVKKTLDHWHEVHRLYRDLLSSLEDVLGRVSNCRDYRGIHSNDAVGIAAPFGNQLSEGDVEGLARFRDLLWYQSINRSSSYGYISAVSLGLSIDHNPLKSHLVRAKDVADELINTINSGTLSKHHCTLGLAYKDEPHFIADILDSVASIYIQHAVLSDEGSDSSLRTALNYLRRADSLLSVARIDDPGVLAKARQLLKFHTELASALLGEA